MPRRNVDPITLSVVRGVLETAQREMTLTLEQTARSSVFNLAHDYSTALFNHTPEMILQGQDIPIHLGSLIPAMKSVARFFEGDIHEGDLILHNDPAYGGSHIIDTCMYYPVFYQGELVFWTVCKGHLTDIGGPVPAGYNPNATEILGETAYPSLTEAARHVTIDLVNVFRNSDDVPPVVTEAIAIGAKAIWLQLGIEHAQAAQEAQAAGLEWVQNRCLMVEQARLGTLPGACATIDP